jgi:hypothetical protein
VPSVIDFLRINKDQKFKLNGREKIVAVSGRKVAVEGPNVAVENPKSN